MAARASRKLLRDLLVKRLKSGAFASAPETINGSSNRGYEARNLIRYPRDITQCRVFSTLFNAVLQEPSSVLDLETKSRSPISLTDLLEVITDDLQILKQNLRSVIDAENPVLISAAEHILGAGGKRMRPALVFLVSRSTAEIIGLKNLTTKHRRFAEVVEMIHTASLTHDDVIDDSDMRRGKETVHQRYDTRTAVFSGDYMFAHAAWCLATLENHEVQKLIAQVFKDFASGEINQACNLFNCDNKLEDYLTKSYCKTASLFAACAKGAAIFSGVDTSIINQMFEYGKNLGLCFQIIDDILDFTQSTHQLGKPAGSDLASGNLTGPVIFALEKEPKLRELIESKFIEPGSIDEAIELVRRCGGIERARDLAKEKADIAIENLGGLPESCFRLALEKVVRYNLERIA